MPSRYALPRLPCCWGEWAVAAPAASLTAGGKARGYIASGVAAIHTQLNHVRKKRCRPLVTRDHFGLRVLRVAELFVYKPGLKGKVI